VTFSVYAKAKERNKIYIRLNSGTGSDQTTTFDLTSGTYSIISNAAPIGTASIQALANGWYRCIVSQPSSGGTISFGIYNGSTTYTGDGISGLYLWGAQLESGDISSYIPSVQTYVSGGGTRYRVNSAGLLAISTNVARMDYTPDNLALLPKLLVEPSARNLLVQSNSPQDAVWTKSLVNLTQNGGTGTDPTTMNNGGFVTSNTTSGIIGYIGQSCTVVNDSSMKIFSVFVRKNSGSIVGLSVEYAGGATPTSAGISLNPSTGVTNTTTLFSSPVYLNLKNYPSGSGGIGWWRLSIGVPNNSTGNTTAVVKFWPSVNNDGSTSWTGGNSANACVGWGMQFEEGYCETSPIISVSNAPSPIAPADVTTSVNGVRQPDVSTFGLIYSNIAENDFPVWSNITNYAVDVSGNNSVIFNHVKYASLQASNIAHQPDTSPTWWSVIGATNAYAMFDSQVGTQTTGAVAGHIYTWIQINSLSSLNFVNVSADTITVKIFSNYVQVYSKVIDFTGRGIPITDYSLTGLPTYTDAYVLIDVYSANAAPAIGNFVVGTEYHLGSTETSPTIGVTDYSIKTMDAFGNPTLTKRGYAKRMNTKQMLEDADVDKTARLLASIRATACVWNANTTLMDRTSNKKSSLIVYGYYKDWEINVAYTTKSYLTATIEGLL
jgi:hypothetical protein